ncbi:MAG TPA: type II toxin-antitoxin system VapC family toxin [Pyrodictium delaneyi]|uniref:Type II toxin-antitoxin system VapC family toxin n=1 Tax=Pyrodictium delaneyi TaxID=1273541 RepID=A0A832ZUX2_9CREN|nr:type II toxin-antitoxin system VapC family toxin [Pyrodictium delaneyi]
MKVFFDSNVLLKYLASAREAKKLVDMAEHGEWEDYVNDIVVSEVVYCYLGRGSVVMPRGTLYRGSRMGCAVADAMGCLWELGLSCSVGRTCL